jgi:hypothetical protein
MAKNALSQINAAFETMREGNAASATYYEQQLPRGHRGRNGTLRSPGSCSWAALTARGNQTRRLGLAIFEGFAGQFEGSKEGTP